MKRGEPARHELGVDPARLLLIVGGGRWCGDRDGERRSKSKIKIRKRIRIKIKTKRRTPESYES